MIRYEIISTGSDGNAVTINDSILIDCGVTYKTLGDRVRKLRLVLLTHRHTDHLNKTTIRLLAINRPTLRFGCCAWLVDTLLLCGVKKSNIDVYNLNMHYQYSDACISPFYLSHDVPNCGYKIHLKTGEKIVYATDCGDLNGISARNYDLYLIEANYIDEDIQQKIKEKKKTGEYIYEYRVLRAHLSKAQCDDFIYSNIGSNGTYVYMHCHKTDETEE